MGIYGLFSYAMAQRTQEIGIRMALGARLANVMGMVIKQGLLLAFIGEALGLFGAFAFSRLLKSLLYGVTTTDPVVSFQFVWG